MKRSFLCVLMVAALLLAACDNGGLPDPYQQNWCYVYDFKLPIEYVNLINGEWVEGVGIVTDTDGEIVANFLHDGPYFQPDVVGIQIARGEGVSGDIYVQAIGDVFTVPVSIDETIPGIAPDPLPLKLFGPVNPDIDGVAVNATIVSSQEIVLEYLIVAGDGASPYDTNPCTDEPTPTATNTPEATHTPSDTPNLTPSATNTPNPNWCWAWTYTDGDGGFAARTTAGTYDAALGWKRNSNTSDPDQIYIYNAAYPITTSTTINDVYFEINNPVSGAYASRVYVFAGSTTPIPTYQSNPYSAGAGASSFHWGSGGLTLTPISINGYIGVGFDPRDGFLHPNGMWAIDYIRFQGTGVNPFPVDNCSPAPTGTPSPTITPTNTPTHTYTPTDTPTRTPIGWAGGTLTATRTATRTPIIVATWTPRPSNTPLPSFTPLPTLLPTLPPPTLPATPTVITATPVTHTPEFSYTPLPTSVFTPFGTPGGTPYGTPVAWGTPWGSPAWTPIAQGTGLPEYEMTPQFGPVLGFLSTAAVQINSLPGSINQYVPNVNPGPLFGYVKWAASCVSAQELVGTTLSPIVCHAMLGLSLNIFLVSVLVIFRVVRLLIKFVTWIIQQVLKMIPTMG